MTCKPEKAFILAAGKGTRLRPHTETMPKPMVPVAERSIIKRTIEKLDQAGVRDIVINLHYLPDVLKSHLEGISRPNIIFSEEDELLETGGGLKNALHHFGNDPYYIINGDALWDESGETSALHRLAEFWNPAVMDILLLLEPKDKMILTAFVGDYDIAPDGKAIRSKDRSGQFMFAGVRIAHPRIFEQSPDGAFSFLELMDKAQDHGRLYALPHVAEWYHISTPEDLAAVDSAFRKQEKQ